MYTLANEIPFKHHSWFIVFRLLYSWICMHQFCWLKFFPLQFSSNVVCQEPLYSKIDLIYLPSFKYSITSFIFGIVNRLGIILRYYYRWWTQNRTFPSFFWLNHDKKCPWWLGRNIFNVFRHKLIIFWLLTPMYLVNWLSIWNLVGVSDRYTCLM